jgi:hypothetical protein
VVDQTISEGWDILRLYGGQKKGLKTCGGVVLYSYI